jgi:hypothetical protein
MLDHEASERRVAWLARIADPSTCSADGTCNADLVCVVPHWREKPTRDATSDNGSHLEDQFMKSTQHKITVLFITLAAAFTFGVAPISPAAARPTCKMCEDAACRKEWMGTGYKDVIVRGVRATFIFKSSGGVNRGCANCLRNCYSYEAATEIPGGIDEVCVDSFCEPCSDGTFCHGTTSGHRGTAAELALAVRQHSRFDAALRKLTTEAYSGSFQLNGGITGARADKEIGGACPGGTKRESCKAQLLQDSGGQCFFTRWVSDSETDCRCKVHLGVPAFQGLNCEVKIKVVPR